MLDTSGQQCPLSFFTPPELLHSVMNGSQYISRRTAATFQLEMTGRLQRFLLRENMSYRKFRRMLLSVWGVMFR